MRTCRYCGGEIEFRHVDGQVKPIHVDGSWCTEGLGEISGKSDKPFSTVLSYVNPNARCPVCGDPVFFYQSPYGGRVFFNNLGWPWPKHECTDHSDAQTGKIKRITELSHRPFRSSSGESLALYQLVAIQQIESGFRLKFAQIVNNLIVFYGDVSNDDMDNLQLTPNELSNISSFVVRTRPDHFLIEFISGRTLRIDEIKIPRQKR